MRRFFDSIILLSYCCLIYWLSAQPKFDIPQALTFQDKILHFGAYFVMGGLVWRAFGGPSIYIAVTFCWLYGLSDEWHQSYVPGRDSSGWDWLADALGSLTAIFLLQRFRYGETETPKNRDAD